MKHFSFVKIPALALTALLVLSAPGTGFDRPLEVPVPPGKRLETVAAPAAQRDQLQVLAVGKSDGIAAIIGGYGCARQGALPTPALKPVEFKQSANYRVKPGDQLEISIWKEEGMRREMLVLPDGTISYPLAGHLKVVGMTPKEIEELLARRLARFFQNPFINVIVKRTSGNQIFVLGEVRSPGAFTINQPIDVMQALSLAGGLSEFADKGDIVVLRRSVDGEQEVIPFKYSSVQRGKNLGSNVKLLSGDTVVVPERSLF